MHVRVTNGVIDGRALLILGCPGLDGARSCGAPPHFPFPFMYPDHLAGETPHVRPPVSTRRRFWVELAIILGFWTSLAILTAGSRVLDPFRDDVSTAERLRSIAPIFFGYYFWAILTPFIFALSRRLSVDRWNWMRRVPLHLAIAFVVAIGVDLYDDAVRVYLFPGSRHVPFNPVRAVVNLWFLNEFMVYLAVLSAGFARDYFFRYQARQAEALALRAQTHRLEAQLSEARLQALRMQINPHFLFNTLHAVSSLVERDPQGVRRMLARLSELLRYTLEDGAEQEVPLRQELAFLDGYLEIQSIRFQGRLAIEKNVSPDVLEALVPNLILQPILENAVTHGAGHADGMGRIWIEAKRVGANLVISIGDNGPGLEGDGLPDEDRGYGLRNTRERLEEMYGDAFTLRFVNRAEGGLVAELTLPFHTTSDLRTATVALDVGE